MYFSEKGSWVLPDTQKCLWHKKLKNLLSWRYIVNQMKRFQWIPKNKDFLDDENIDCSRNVDLLAVLAQGSFIKIHSSWTLSIWEKFHINATFG
jgi:hypothetical protein